MAGGLTKQDTKPWGKFYEPRNTGLVEHCESCKLKPPNQKG